jgi:multidrug resistance efflux pump
MKRNTIVILILVLAVIGGIGIAGYYSYQNAHYVITDNAKISSYTTTISPEIQGKIRSWNIKAGDNVKAGQVLGTQNTDSSIKSSAMNAQSLNNDADNLASKAEIKSPIDGKVIQTSVVGGQMVAPSTVVAIIADISNIYVNANIKETDIFKIKPGQKVKIAVDAYPDKLLAGYVEDIEPAGESVFSIIPSQNASANYTKVTELIPVKISIVKEDHVSLLPGMNVTVKIYLK